MSEVCAKIFKQYTYHNVKIHIVHFFPPCLKITSSNYFISVLQKCLPVVLIQVITQN